MSAPAAPASPTLWHGIGDVPSGFGPCVVTLGVFDGLHRGHRRLVECALREADALGLPSVLVTFDPHPARVLGLPRDTARLSTVERRAELAREIGVDAVCVLPFTTEFAKVGAADFVEQVLVAGLNAKAVAVGADFTFGHRGGGTVDTLRALGRRYGFSTRSVDLLRESDARCSSSAVRECLRRGDIDGATRVLGRPHRVEGELRAVGRNSANIVCAPGTALPAPGRYAGRVPGVGAVALLVDEDRELYVESADVRSSSVSIDFTGRRAVS